MWLEKIILFFKRNRNKKQVPDLVTVQNDDYESLSGLNELTEFRRENDIHSVILNIEEGGILKMPGFDPGNDENNPITIKSSDMDASSKKISNEFEYLEALIHHRLTGYFPLKKEDSNNNPFMDFQPVPDFPPLESWKLPWQKFAHENGLDNIDENGYYTAQRELVLLLIGIAPHVKPDLFDRVIAERINGSADFPNIGGVRGRNSRFFLPTGETALFLIAGDDFDRRANVKKLFGAEHLFWEKKIIWLEDMQNGEPAMHGRLIMSPDYVDLLSYGVHKSPQFSISFPAKKIAPAKDEYHKAPTFEDLVIPDELKEQINELKSWLKFNDELMARFGMKDILKKGYRSLFYGPPGTGKTYTAEILGNDLKKDVFKIDLSMVVSKYIGETEKNLELLFARAEDKGWILFFDEADALFGKRTNVRDAHDKYANQEVSYLLQRIEDYNGLVILATNMKNNIDDAFIRRFNSILKFPFPDQGQRARIWEKALPKNALFMKRTIAGDPPVIKEEPADIPDAVKKYELTGGNIINVVHYASIKAVEALHEKERNSIKKQWDLACKETEVQSSRESDNDQPQLVIYLSDVLDGIKRELIKEGKPFSL